MSEDNATIDMPSTEDHSAPNPVENELTLDQIFTYAQVQHHNGNLPVAENIYRYVHSQIPEDPAANHFLGIILTQTDRVEEGLGYIHSSIKMSPANASYYNNLGNSYIIIKQYDEAVSAFEQATKLDPNDANVYCNLGAAHRHLKQFDKAEASFLKSLELMPENLSTLHNMGTLLCNLDRLPEAITYYNKAYVLNPANDESSHYMAYAYMGLGEFEKAADIYRKRIAANPDDVVSQHHLIACTQVGVPERCDDAYVKSVFDGFAESFDKKLAELNYCAPDLVAERLTQLEPEAKGDLIILDAGCGTGLCGDFLKPYAQALLGVDLSAGMLKKASMRDLYDQLIEAELTAFISAMDGALDLIVSADTLVYFGALDGVLNACYRALRPDHERTSRLIFTVEALSSDMSESYFLNGHGRYSHSARYVKDTLAACGFTQILIEDVFLRMEKGLPVNGLLVSATKSAQSVH